MRRLILILTLFYSLSIYSQNSSDLYNQGIIAFSKNQFVLADSLFTVSLKYRLSPDAFYNRAATKLVLRDTCNACKDLLFLKDNYMDKEGTKLLNEICFRKLDTIYYDKKFLPINKNEKYRYYEVTQYPKCDTIVKGEIHKYTHKSTTVQVSALNLNIEKSDIYALYVMQSNTKYYISIYSSTFGIDNKEVLDKFKEFFKSYFSKKFDFSKLKHANKWISMDLYIDDEGNLTNGKIVDNPFSVFDIELQNQIKTEIIESLKRIPKLIPEKLANINVHRRFSIGLGL